MRPQWQSSDRQVTECDGVLPTELSTNKLCKMKEESKHPAPSVVRKSNSPACGKRWLATRILIWTYRFDMIWHLMSKRMELPPSTIIMHIALPDHHPYGMSATCTNYRIAPTLRLAYCTLEHCTPIANHLERNYMVHISLGDPFPAHDCFLQAMRNLNFFTARTVPATTATATTQRPAMI